jgi:hypothetical protein
MNSEQCIINSGKRIVDSVKYFRYPVFAFRFPLVMLLLVSCNAVNDASYTLQIVVQGYLYANEPLDSIVVRRTIPIGSSTGSERINNAKVTLSTGDTIYTLHADTSFSPGGRFIGDGTIIIQAGKSYSLRVEALGEVATSSTTVPLAIHLDSATLEGQSLSLKNTDTISYPALVDSLSSPGIHLWWSASPGSAGYGLEVLSLDSTADTIIDAVSSSLGDSGAMGRYRFFIQSTDEQIVWVQYTRFGLNVIRALALDRNYEDYILGLYLSGSQFNNSTLHVTGGLGVFGSAARASKKVYLK